MVHVVRKCEGALLFVITFFSEVEPELVCQNYRVAIRDFLVICWVCAEAECVVELTSFFPFEFVRDTLTRNQAKVLKILDLGCPVVASKRARLIDVNKLLDAE
jgi:hypothetical protein